MQIGLLIGGILSLFGAIAAAALVVAHFQSGLMPQSLTLWIIFVICFGTGTLTTMMSARGKTSASFLTAYGVFALVAGVCAGVLALTKALGILQGHQGIQLWILFGVCLPVGTLLLLSARGLPESE